MSGRERKSEKIIDNDICLPQHIDKNRPLLLYKGGYTDYADHHLAAPLREKVLSILVYIYCTYILYMNGFRTFKLVLEYNEFMSDVTLPHFKSSAQHSWCWFFTATKSGVWALTSAILGSAPWLRSARTHSGCPAKTCTEMTKPFSYIWRSNEYRYNNIKSNSVHINIYYL